MKFILSILTFVIFVGCTSRSTPEDLDPLITETGITISFNKIVEFQNFKFVAPSTLEILESTNERMVLKMESGVVKEPGTVRPMEHEFLIHAELTELPGELNSAEKCNPSSQISKDRKINTAYRYENISVSTTVNNSLFYTVENNCNFPGALVSPPQEIWTCTENGLNKRGASYQKFCRELIAMDYVKAPLYEVKNFPAFFENKEFVFQNNGKTFRIRMFINSNSTKGVEILKQIFMSAVPLVE